jgi:hypothetical protein
MLPTLKSIPFAGSCNVTVLSFNIQVTMENELSNYVPICTWFIYSTWWCSMQNYQTITLLYTRWSPPVVSWLIIQPSLYLHRPNNQMFCLNLAI